MYQEKDYSTLGIAGLSEELLSNHLSLYQAYVKNTNHFLEHLADESDDTRYAELKRRFGWEWNGMRLHEYFFENIGASKELGEGELKDKIEADFGSTDKWLIDFKRTCQIRGSGWAAIYFDKQADKLLNVWMNEHNHGHLSCCQLILIIDMFEHAFMPDRIKRPEYIEVILKAIDWEVAERRFREANE